MLSVQRPVLLLGKRCASTGRHGIQRQFIVAVHASLFSRLAALASPLSFKTAWAAAYVCFMTFNLVDLVVIDLGVIPGLRPRWAGARC